MSLLGMFGAPEALPALTLKAQLVFGDSTSEGRLVQAVALPWFQILKRIADDPDHIYQIDSRAWEEIIAGAYKQAEFDEVILTPRSGDHGRDVIALKHGVGAIRLFDQIKAYKPGHLVTAEEVMSLFGVVAGFPNVSKGVVTTTSAFAPRILDHPAIRDNVPFRLELKPREVLLPWLEDLFQQGIGQGGSNA